MNNGYSSFANIDGWRPQGISASTIRNDDNVNYDMIARDFSMTISSSLVRRLHGVHQILRVVLVGVVLLGRGGRLLHVRRVVTRYISGERRERSCLAYRADGTCSHQVTRTEPEASEVGISTEP